MGSYLSIHNNTRDTYNVKVGVDEAAIRILSLVGVVLATLSVVLVTAGMAAPVWSVAMVSMGVAKIVGLTAAQLAAVVSIASAVAGITIAADLAGLAIAIGVLISDQWQDEGFETIRPGNKHQYGKYSLSLWRQGTCRRVRPDPNNAEQLIVDVVYMRPIFSGATNNSTLVHNIQHWIDKWGHEETTVVEISADDISRVAIDDAVSQYNDINWLAVIEEARKRAMEETLDKEGIDAHLRGESVSVL